MRCGTPERLRCLLSNGHLLHGLSWNQVILPVTIVYFSIKSTLRPIRGLLFPHAAFHMATEEVVVLYGQEHMQSTETVSL